MEKELKIKSKSGYNINAKIFLPEQKKINKIVIACHGFGGDKESSAIYLLAEKVNKKNIAVICFDFPGHGKSEVDTSKLTLENCINDLESVEDYIKTNYGNVNIGFFGTSFGAYILLLKIAKRGGEDKYSFIILRAPAICMNKIYLSSLLNESLDSYKQKGYTKIGFDREMNVPYEFYNELNQNNLFELYNSDKNMLILHGTEDDTAPIEDTIRFIKVKNPKIQLHKLIGTDHRMKKPGELEEVIKLSIDYIEHCMNKGE